MKGSWPQRYLTILFAKKQQTVKETTVTRRFVFSSLSFYIPSEDYTNILKENCYIFDSIQNHY